MTLTPAAAFAAGISACGRRQSNPGFRGYAFVANEEGQAIAAVDLETMAVARHIALESSPTVVLCASQRPSVYALSPGAGMVHEISVDRLALSRKLRVGQVAVGMRLSSDERRLYVLAKDPKALVEVNLETFQVESRITLPEEPVDLALAPDGKTAAISFHTHVRLVDLADRKLRESAGQGDFGALRYISDSTTLIAADRAQKRLSLYQVSSSQLISHLPLPVRPDHLCFNADGGQLFVTGEGMDGVVIVFPYHTPEVAESVLAGHAPGHMAASQQYLFVASPTSGDVSILEINSRKVIAVVSTGSDPGFVIVTPDDQYTLVLNRKSGDVAVLRVNTITKKRDRRAAVLTVIPVGSRPVSAAVRAV